MDRERLASKTIINGLPYDRMEHVKELVLFCDNLLIMGHNIKEILQFWVKKFKLHSSWFVGHNKSVLLNQANKRMIQTIQRTQLAFHLTANELK